jgi:lysophospholipase L1-like esterase
MSQVVSSARILSWSVAALLAMGATSHARPGVAPSPPAALVDPCIDGSDTACHRHALDGFYQALADTAAHHASRVTRISWFGDSLTADDQITDRLRQTLQAKFGDGGPGFVFAVPPHPFCQHRAIKRATGGAWVVHGVSGATPADRLMGLGGGDAENAGGGHIRIAPSATDLTSADLYFVAQPHGGTVEVDVDGQEAALVATAADEKHGEFQLVTFGGAAAKIDLRASGKVRLFGVALEAAAGVVVDNLGVVNSTAKSLAKNRAEHWQRQLAHRAPDLTVIMLGTNEAEWIPAAGTALVEHERIVAGLVKTVRAANPDRSCLVISPFDQIAWREPGAPPRASIPAMVAAQRRAATTAGCAFWDAYQWMGGKGSSLGWYHAQLLTNDFQHPTTAGAQRIADALSAGLLAGLGAYRAH